MKSKLRTAAAVMLAFSLLTGCGSKGDTISSGMANSSLFNDMQKGEAVEAETVTEAFNTALEKADASVSATIDTQVSIELTEGGETVTTKNTTQIMYQPDENGEADTAEEADTSAEDEAAQEQNEEQEQDKPMLAYVNINNEYNDESNTMEGFYQGGYLYYTLEDNKVKESMDYSDLMSIVGNYAVQFDADVIDSAYKVESKKETQYTVKFDPNSMADMMMNNMAGAGAPMDDGEDMVVNEAYLYFAVDSNGCLSGFDMELDAKFTAAADNAEGEETTDTDSEEETVQEAGIMGSESGDSPFKYSVVANFSNLDSTKVTPFEELDSYEDVNTVLERMQAEEAEAEEGETSATEDETEAAEAETKEVTEAE